MNRSIARGLPWLLLLLTSRTRAADVDPVLIARWPWFSGDAVEVVVEGPYAYTTVSQTGLVIFDADPAAVSLDPEPVGVFEGAPASGLAVSGGLAYMAIGSRLVVIDVGDPARPREVGSHDGVGEFVVSGDFLYSRDYDHLDVIDLGDPAAPRLAGRLEELNAYFSALFVSGGLAYLGDQLGRFWVIDVSDPARPRRVALHQLEVRHIEGVFVSGSHAYVTTFQGEGLIVLDVSDPASPRRVGGYGSALGGSILVEGDRAYLKGLVFDVSVPSTPRPVAIFDPSAERWDGLFLAGGLAYVAAGRRGLRVFDVSTPSDPERVGTYFQPVPGGGFFDARNVFIDGSRAYLAASGGLHIVDVSDPARPERLAVFGDFPIIDDQFPGINDVFVAGGHAFIAGGGGGLRVLDVTDPAAPRHVGAVPADNGSPDRGGPVWGVFASGSHVYAAADHGLQVVDASDPAAPRIVGEIGHDEYTGSGDLFVAGGRAYVISNRTLEIIDVGDPAAPARLGTLAGSTWGREGGGVFVSGSHAYVADGHDSLVVVDVSDPADPRPVSEVRTGNGAGDVFVAGDRAFITGSSGAHRGFHVIDVSDPAAPWPLEHYATLDAARDIAVAGGLVYVAGEMLEIIDAGVPPLPDRHAGTYDTSLVVQDVTVSGSLAHVVDDRASLHVFDVADPAAPRRIGKRENTRNAETSTSRNVVFLDGDLVHVLDHPSYDTTVLEAIDVADPRSPRAVLRYDAGFTAEHSFVAEGYACFAATDFDARGRFVTRVHVVDLRDPAAVREAGVYSTNGGPSHGLFVSHGFLYLSLVLDDGSGQDLELIDVRDPGAPRLVRRDAGRPGRPFVSGARAYTGYQGADGGGFEILDVADPLAPRVLGRYIGHESAWAAILFASAEQVFIDCGGACFEVIDVSDAANPRRAGSATGAVLRRVAGKHAFASGGAGLEDLLILELKEREEPPRFLRGDCDGDGRVEGLVTDAIFLLDRNFRGGPRPPCLAACDADGDGRVEGVVTDAVYLLSFNFLGGPPPPAPFPECGPGGLPADAGLGCESPGCEPARLRKEGGR